MCVRCVKCEVCVFVKCVCVCDDDDEVCDDEVCVCVCDDEVCVCVCVIRCV